MSSIYAKVVVDSIANNVRLTTLECYYPLMIHAQLMTHRMFSRNAQSNRAMPVAKMLEQVRNDPAMPAQFGKNRPGMSASEETPHIGIAVNAWHGASFEAAHFSEVLSRDAEVHKQVANRLTMPFQYIKVIVTATEWDNFFKLRLHDADPTMMELARKMKEAMDNSTPVLLEPGEYHLPYVDLGDFDDSAYPFPEAIKCSVARCARVSYNNHDNSSPDIEKDIALADRLLKDGHLSPFEHQATPMDDITDISKCKSYRLSSYEWPDGATHVDRDHKLWSSNFRGWIQYRNLV